MKTGWAIYLHFGIVLHKNDRVLLESIQTFFKGVASIRVKGNKLIHYRVSCIKLLEVILQHF